MQRSTKSGLCLRGQEIWGNQGKKKVSIIKAFIDSISIQSHLLQEALPASPPPPAREGRQMPLSCTRARAALRQSAGLAVLGPVGFSKAGPSRLSLCGPQLVADAP